MSPRTGGNGIPDVLARGCGLDIEAATIRFALGEMPTLPGRIEPSRETGSLVFGVDRAGMLQRVPTLDELRAACPEVYGLKLFRQPGDRVEAFEHNGAAVGCALFDCPGPEGYALRREAIQAGLRLGLEGGR